MLEDRDHELFWSAVGSSEIAVKVSIGKLPRRVFSEPAIDRARARLGARHLPLGHAAACEVARLPVHHRDPLDRLLVAQARVRGLRLVTADRSLHRYDVRWVW